MKCLETEENIQLLIDNELQPLKTQQLKSHLATCEFCRVEFERLQKLKQALKAQPQILPSDSFDKRMLQAFQKHQKFQTKEKTNWFASFLTFSKPIFTAAIFAFAIGLAFFIGRMSVSSPPQSSSEISDNTEVKPVEKLISSDPIEKVVTQTKVVTKYVEVPIVREKTIEKKIYINNPIQLKAQNLNSSKQKELLAKEENKKQQEDIAKQFNLKDLQPVAKITYQIIRKGENNE